MAERKTYFIATANEEPIDQNRALSDALRSKSWRIHPVVGVTWYQGDTANEESGWIVTVMKE